MHLGTIAASDLDRADRDWRPAAFVAANHYVDLRAAAQDGPLGALLSSAPWNPAWLGLRYRDALRRLVECASTQALDGCTIGPPLPRPGKMIACGRNYLDHVREGQKIWEARGKIVERPAVPAAFIKVASAITHHAAAIEIPTDILGVDYEVELVVVIGSDAFRVTPETALDHVAGYTICNDMASRPIQFAEMEQQIGIVMGKNLPGFAPLGPYMVTADEIPDPQALDIGLCVNGAVRQNAHTRDMLFGVAELISYWSRLGLQVGDILLTGTPAGVAVGRPMEQRHDFFLKDGDIVEAWVSGIGTLSNQIRYRS